MRFRTLTATAFLSILCTNAIAATAECPSADSITQEKLTFPKKGYLYKAPGPEGQIWKGENPEGQEADLATFKFSGAAYRAKSSENNTDVVSCDFEGDAQDAFARMTLYSFRDWNGAQGAKWQTQSPAPDRVESCSSTQQKECEFDYSKLEIATKPQT